MKREAVASVAVFAAAVSIGALGFAVLWGVDLTEPFPLAGSAPTPGQRVPPSPKVTRPAGPIVLAPSPPGEDAKPAASPGATVRVPGDAVPPAAIAQPGEVTPLPSRAAAPIVLAPPTPGEDTRPAPSPAGSIARVPGDAVPPVAIAQPGEVTPLPSRAAVPIVLAPSTPGEDVRPAPSPNPRAKASGDLARAAAPTRAPDEPSVLGPQPPLPVARTPGEDTRPVRAPSARLTDPAPAGDRALLAPPQVSALTPEPGEPPAEAPPPVPDPVSTVVPERPEQGHANTGPPKRPAVRPRAAMLPRALPPAREPPRQRDPLDVPGVNVVSGVPAVPNDPPGMFVVRGVPPVPENSPGIVRPGPLIIEVPASARR